MAYFQLNFTTILFKYFNLLRKLDENWDEQFVA